MNKPLHGKIALVTGGSTGIGLGAARELVAQGARVFITGRRQAELDAAVAALGPAATALRADASVLADLDAVYAQIAKSAGRLDILFANAGGGDMLPLGAITEEHFDRIFGTNVRGVLFTVRDFGPGVPKGQMKKIFELFYRPADELTRETVGTGIGLALVRQLATAMGARVDVRNREPGAEFRLHFPSVRQRE